MEYRGSASAVGFVLQAPSAKSMGTVVWNLINVMHLCTSITFIFTDLYNRARGVPFPANPLTEL